MHGMTWIARASRLPLASALVLGTFAPASLAVADERTTLPVGQVVESVVCLDDPAQTYALYLPSTYTPQRPWPILYAFDPRGRGSVPTNLFRGVAERLGYIVVGSNNSRNGPWPPIVAAMNAVWADTHARLALDPRRVYATGMSGGNAPAIQLATRQGAGIIACAGAIKAEEIAPVDGGFSWISTAGTADFNFDLNRTLVAALVARGVVARLSAFDGGHAWPPEDVAVWALEAVHLSAMRSGRVAREATFVESYLRNGQERARDLAGRSLADDAAEEYAALARELKGLEPTEPLEAEARRLRDTPEARENVKRHKSLAERSERESVRLFVLRGLVEGKRLPRTALSDGAADSMGGSEDAGKEIMALMELESRLDRLARDAESADADARLVARRARDGFFIETYFSAMDRRDGRNFDAALQLLRLCARMRPTNSGPVYELARTHAARGDKKKALAELQKAKTLGFAEPGRLEVEPEWAPLRTEPKFREIVAALRAPAP